MLVGLYDLLNRDGMKSMFLSQTKPVHVMKVMLSLLPLQKALNVAMLSGQTKVTLVV